MAVGFVHRLYIVKSFRAITGMCISYKDLHVYNSRRSTQGKNCSLVLLFDKFPTKWVEESTVSHKVVWQEGFWRWRKSGDISECWREGWKFEKLLSKKCFNRGMLSDFMLKSLFPTLLLVLSVLLNKTAKFCRSLFGCILGHEYDILGRDMKSALRTEYLHSSYKRSKQETWSYSLPRPYLTSLSLMFFNAATHLRQSESQMHPQKC